MLHTNIAEEQLQRAADVASRSVPAHRKEMGATPAEIFRLLPLVAPSHTTKIDAAQDWAIITNGKASVFVDCERRPDRRIGALTVPVTIVHIRFHRYSRDEAFEFLARFDLTYLRMGG